MVEPKEELEPLFCYKRVQPFAVVSLDDDDDDYDDESAAKRKKVEEDDDDDYEEVKLTKVVNHDANNDDEDWLPPPPKVSVDIQNQLEEDSTIKELRLKKHEFEALRRPAGDILREVEESLRMELGNSLHDSTEVENKASKPACERPKMVISIQNKDGTQQFRVFKDDKLVQIFKRYAEKVKCDVQNMVFCFDGDKISEKATPDSLGMEDDDIIEVHMK